VQIKVLETAKTDITDHQQPQDIDQSQGDIFTDLGQPGIPLANSHPDQTGQNGCRSGDRQALKVAF
jgi:hypothetical protein